MDAVAKIWFPPLVVVAALLPLGAQSPVAFHFVLFCIAAGFLTFAVRAISSDGFVTAATFTSASVPAAVFAMPVYVAAQFAARSLTGYGDGPLFEVAESAVELAALALFYLIVRAALRRHEDVRKLVIALTLIGGLEALYGLLNLLAGNERLLFWTRWAFLDSATGTLVSRNHFAFLMELLLPVPIALAVMAGSPSRRRTSTTGDQRARTVLVGTIAVTCALALVFSHSRMGIASFTVAYLGTLGLARILRHQQTPEQDAAHGRVVAIAGVVIALVLAGAIGLDSILERFVRVERDLAQGRWPIWQATLQMFFDQPLFGQGWGTFRELLPSYRSGPTGLYYTHAHNDYLEVLAEGGIVGFTLIVWLIVLFARRLIATLSLPLSHVQRSVIFWFAVSLNAALVHSFADYGLRTTGVVVTFVAIAALFSRVTEEPSLITERKQHGSRKHKY